MMVAVLLVTLVGIEINCSRGKEKQISRKPFVRGVKFWPFDLVLVYNIRVRVHSSIVCTKY